MPAACRRIAAGDARSRESLLLLSHGLGRHSRALPRLESAPQRMHFAKPKADEFPCHTGAGLFMTSGAVGNQRTVARQQLRVVFQFLDRNVNRSGDLGRVSLQ